MATTAEFKLLFPQFAATDDDDIERWFAQFPLRFTLSRFGLQATMAIYAYTGHQLTLYPPGGSASTEDGLVRGPITSEKIADLARGYGAAFDLSRVPSSLMEFTATLHGLRLIGIILSRRHAHSRVIRTGSSRAADPTDAADSGS